MIELCKLPSIIRVATFFKFENLEFLWCKIFMFSEKNKQFLNNHIIELKSYLKTDSAYTVLGDYIITIKTSFFFKLYFLYVLISITTQWRRLFYLSFIVNKLFFELQVYTWSKRSFFHWQLLLASMCGVSILFNSLI